jgi:TRAP-type C4-dicarboxylate transport system permease small subunit
MHGMYNIKIVLVVLGILNVRVLVSSVLSLWSDLGSWLFLWLYFLGLVAVFNFSITIFLLLPVDLIWFPDAYLSKSRHFIISSD